MKSAFALALLVLLTACGPSKPANLGYDANANATQLVEAAKREAAKSGRRVLIIAGGDWCRWCHVLDEFLSDNADAKAAMDASFVVVKVYVDDDTYDESFFDRMPEAQGYPHMWVLMPYGGVKSIPTAPLEQGDDDYDKGRFMAMLQEAAQ
jgi:thioredoxin-related protein